MPLVFIRLPASTKNGTASRVKLSTELVIWRGISSSGTPEIQTPKAAATPIEMLTGTRSSISPNMTTIMRAVITGRTPTDRRETG